MTGHERIEALYRRELTDRVPVVHKGYAFCAKHVGIPVADVYKNVQASYHCQKKTYEDFGFDGGPFYTFVAYGAGEFGGNIEYKKDPNAFGPEVTKRPIADWEEFDPDTLPLPDYKTCGCIPAEMEFARLAEKEGSEIAFICGTPFTHTANLFGVSSFMECLLVEPDIAHACLRKMTDHALQVAKYFIDTFGPDRVLARGVAPTDSNALISPAIFEEFSLPYLKELNTKVIEMGAKACYMHVCGDHSKNLPLWQQVPRSGHLRQSGSGRHHDRHARGGVPPELRKHRKGQESLKGALRVYGGLRGRPRRAGGKCRHDGQGRQRRGLVRLRRLPRAAEKGGNANGYPDDDDKQGALPCPSGFYHKHTGHLRAGGLGHRAGACRAAV